MLPDKDGLAVLTEVKQDPKKKNTNVLMLTNLGQDNIMKKSLELGAIGYLVKADHNPYQVLDEVKKYLASNP